jgi:tetratricopeptide (TPR) repeat protein
MGASLLYNSLRAEMYAAQGQFAGAAQLLAEVAKNEGERPELYARATQLALMAGQPELGLKIVGNWRRAQSQSAPAARYALQLHLLLRQRDAAVAAMRDILRYTKADDLDSAMTVLPGYFSLPQEAQNPDDKDTRPSIDMSTARALEAILQPYAQDPKHSATAWGVIASVRAQSGQSPAAVQAATQALALDLGNANAAWVLLQALQAKDEKGGALTTAAEQHAAQTALAKFVAHNKKLSPSLRVRYAAYLLEANQPQAALEQVRVLTQSQAQSSRFWLMQGLIEMEIAPQDGAGDDSLKQAWRLIQDSQDDEQGALRDEVMIALSRLAQLRGDLPQALSWMEQTSPQEAERTQPRRAGLLVKLGRWQEALKVIDALPESKTLSARQKTMLQIDVLSQAGQSAAAFDKLNTFVQAHPKDDEARYQLAMLAERKGDLEAMERLLRQVIAAEPQNALAYNALGYALADRNLRLPEARALLEKALQLAPDNAMIQDSVGWAAFRQGDLPAAQKHLTAAYAQLPDAEIGAHLGEVLWQLGQQDAARAVWRKAQGSDPDNTALQKTLKRLKVKL